MKARKIVLLALDAVLLVILIFQLIFKSSDKTKTLEILDEPNEILISTTTESFSLIKEDDKWFVGEKKYPANESYVVSAVNAVKSIKLLDKVGTASSDSTLLRYELDDDKKISVEVKSNGKVVRTLIIGKDSSTGSQNYVMVDNSKDIYLATGNLRNEFDKTVNYFRSRIVLSLDANEISSVELSNENENSWILNRIGSGDDVAWNCSVEDVEVDSEKATEWFNSLDSITTPNWYDDEPYGEKIISAKITAAFKTITVDIFAFPITEEDKTQKYWAKCSETPYAFEMASYTVQKFQKTTEDISK